MGALKVVAKGVGWLVLVGVGLVAATLLTAIIVGRTEWGQRKILSIALPVIQRQLAGHLSIGRIGGDLTRELELYDVRIDDVEHQPAVKVRVLKVRYDLSRLLRRTIDVAKLEAEGAWLHARVL